MDEIDAFLNDLEMCAAPNTDKTYQALCEEYHIVFGKSVPLDMIPPQISSDKIIDLLDSCVSTSSSDEIECLVAECGDFQLY